MADPTEDIPPNCHLGRRDRDFELGALGLEVARAGWIRAVVQLADQLHRSLKRMKAPVAMVANVHHPPTYQATTFKDIELARSKVRILGPGIWHPVGLHAVLRSLD